MSKGKNFTARRGGNFYVKQGFKIHGDDDDAMILAAIYGETESDYEKSLQYEMPDIFLNKIDKFRVKSVNKSSSMVAYGKTRYIDKSEFLDLYSAVSFANMNNVIMNTGITISWDKLGYGAIDEAYQMSQYFLARFRDWCGSKRDALWPWKNESNSPATFIYVHEIGKIVGFHTHIQAFVPPELSNVLKRWCALFVRKHKRRETDVDTAIFASVRATPSCFSQWRVFNYMMKGADPQAEIGISSLRNEPVYLGDIIEFPYKPLGLMKCRKVCGASENIRSGARHNYGFSSLMERGVIDVREIYYKDRSIYDRTPYTCMDSNIIDLSGYFTETMEEKVRPMTISLSELMGYPQLPEKVKSIMI